MSRSLHKYVIVHYAAHGAIDDMDYDVCEQLDTISAATPRQAVDSYCLEHGVHRRSTEHHGRTVYQEWYEAEEVPE